MRPDLKVAARSIQSLAESVSTQAISAGAKQRAFRKGIEQIVTQLVKASLEAPSKEDTSTLIGRVELPDQASPLGQEEALGELLAHSLDAENIHLLPSEIRAMGTSRSPAVIHLQKALQSRELAQQIFSKTLPGCAAVITKNGEIVDEFGCGLDEPGGNPRTGDQRQHFASVSKQFTARCILELEKEGKLYRSDDIRKHLPEGFPLPRFYIVGSDGKREEVIITIDHLLYMESGLPNVEAYLCFVGKTVDDLKSTQALLDLYFSKGLDSLMLAFKPGDKDHSGEMSDYQNINYLILEKIVECRSGQTLREYAEDKIFEPLGMRATHFVDPDKPGIEQTIRGYRIDEKEGTVKEATPQNSVSGCTGVIGTPFDMAKWYGHLATDETARKLFQPRYGNPIRDKTAKAIEKCQKHIEKLKLQQAACRSGKSGRMKRVSLGDQIEAHTERLKELQNKMLTLPTELEYACGLMVMQRGQWNIVWHNGGIEGFRTESLFIESIGNPTENFGIFLAANRGLGSVSGMQELCFNLGDIWSGEKLFSPKEKDLPVADVLLESEEKTLPTKEVEKSPIKLEEFEPFVGTYYCPTLGVSYEMSVYESDGHPVALELKLIKDKDKTDKQVIIGGLVPDRKNPGQLCHNEEPKITLRLGTQPGQVLFSDLAGMSLAELAFMRVE